MWREWLQSSDDTVADRAIWLLSIPAVIQARSVEVARLVAPYLAQGEKWRARFQRLFQFGAVYQSREMFDVFLTALRTGVVRRRAKRMVERLSQHARW